MSKHIFFVRHGETEWNRLKLLQGAEHDVGLNDSGKQQATKTGQYLNKHQGNLKFDCIITSPMRRCMETTSLIAREIGYDGTVGVDALLKEKRCGYMSSLDEKDKEKKEEAMKIVNEMLNIFDPLERIEKLGMYEEKLEKYGVESSCDAIKRCCELYAKIASSPFQKIIVVTHSGIMKHMVQAVFGMNMVPKSKYHGNCNIMYITVYDTGNSFLVMGSTNEHLIDEKDRVPVVHEHL